jgi:tRNA-dihydrouridine synthase B
VRTLPAPVVLSGGMNEPGRILDAFERTGCEAVMLARGALGNPWLFARLLGDRDGEPGAEEVLDELEWVMARAVEHLGPGRAARYLRKFYPWYLDRLGAGREAQAALQDTATIEAARDVLDGLRPVSLAA